MPPAKAAKKGTPRMPKNYEIAPGISRFSSARMYHKRGLWEKLKKAQPKKQRQAAPAEKFKTKPVGGDKNGKERKVPITKEPKLLPQVPNKTAPAHSRPSKTRLRSSITPGTILILLTGPHRGKRVVFLKQMEKSGLLLITGPLKLNATPLRRVAQSFVIATKTTLDISGTQIPGHINDDYFKKESKDAKRKKAKSEGIFAKEEKEDNVLPEQKKTDQKSVDKTILAAIAKHPEKKYVNAYLGSRFSLAKNQYPHNMTF